MVSTGFQTRGTSENHGGHFVPRTTLSLSVCDFVGQMISF